MGESQPPVQYLKGCHYALGLDTTASLFDAVRGHNRDSAAFQHDARGAVFLHRQVNRALHVRLLPRAAQDVGHAYFREHARGLRRTLCLDLDSERVDGLPLFPQDVDDVDSGAPANAEEHDLHRARALPRLAFLRVMDEDSGPQVTRRVELFWRAHLDRRLQRGHGPAIATPAMNLAASLH